MGVGWRVDLGKRGNSRGAERRKGRGDSGSDVLYEVRIYFQFLKKFKKERKGALEVNNKEM